MTFGVTPPLGPFEHIDLLRDPYVLLTQTGSPLADRGVAPPLTEIGRMPLIAYSRSTYGMEGLLRARGIEPNVVFRTDESAAVQRLVAAGVGVALVAQLSIDSSIPGVVALDASRRLPPALDRAHLAPGHHALGCCRDVRACREGTLRRARAGDPRAAGAAEAQLNVAPATLLPEFSGDASFHGSG